MYMYVSKQKLRYKVTQRGVSRSSLKSKKKMIILAINYRLVNKNRSVNKNRIDYLLALKFYYFVYLSIKLSLYRKLNIFSF